jgi:hypothetical protein
MALHEVIEKHKVTILGQEIRYTNKYITYTEGTIRSYKPSSSMYSCASRLFKYEYVHPNMGPTLYVNPKGEKFITPTFQKVHPQTTYKDIEWIKPEKIEEKLEKGTWKFESSSEKGIFYKVRQNGDKFTCNCSGFWRVKDKSKGCKHIQEVKKQLSK